MRLHECADRDDALPLVLRPKPLVLWHLVLCGPSTGPRDKGDSGHLAAEVIELRLRRGYVVKWEPKQRRGNVAKT